MLQRKQNAVDIMPKEGEDSVAFGSASWAWTDEDANRIEYRGARRMPPAQPHSASTGGPLEARDCDISTQRRPSHVNTLNIASANSCAALAQWYAEVTLGPDFRYCTGVCTSSQSYDTNEPQYSNTDRCPNSLMSTTWEGNMSTSRFAARPVGSCCLLCFSEHVV
jgi:hypothetical protein